MARNILKKNQLEFPKLIVSKKGLEFYKNDVVEKLKFTSDIYLDFEVINENLFKDKIREFLGENNITKLSVVIILSSDIYFDKKLSSVSNNDLEIHNFSQMVPLGNKIVREYPSEKNSTVIVANKPLLNLLTLILEESKLKIISVVPQYIYDQIKFDQKLLKDANLLPKTIFKSFQPNINLKIKLPRSVLLGFVFIFLVLVLIVQMSLSKPLKSSNPNNVPVATSSATPKENQVENTLIKILYFDNYSQNKSDQLKNLLEKSGFTNILIEKSNNQSAVSKTNISFSQKFPVNYKDKVIYNVNKIFNDVSIQDTNESKLDIIIILGR